MLHLMFVRKGMRRFVTNWQDVARGLFKRVYRESVGRVVDKNTKELPGALLAYPGVKSEWKNPIVLCFMPVIPLSLVKATGS